MSLLREMVDHIRDLRSQVADLKRRLNQLVMTGTVKASEGDKVKILIGDGEEGEIVTPALRVASRTGNRNGGVSHFSKLGDGEQVTIISPGGEINETSYVMSGPSTEDDPSPGSAEQDGEKIVRGNASLDLRDGFAKLTVGSTSILLDGDTITLTGKVQINGGQLRHNSKNVGDSHIHGGVTPGPANTSVPAN